MIVHVRIGLALCAAGVAAAAAWAEPVRGVTLSTHTDGRDWASPRIAETLRDIRSLGAGWVAIHPYAGIAADGSVRFRRFEPDTPPEALRHPIREAHAAGLKILIKPHLAYWGSPFAWRGEIAFDEPEAWNRFWRDYEAWIVQLARATRDADGFVVGTELDRTLGDPTRWRRLIAEVRAATEVPLTYAANWTDFERVTFWDRLDVIGIQAYFPLTDQADPPPERIREGWRRVMQRLGRYARAQNRSIVFTELGYNRAFDTPVEPWDHDTDGPAAERVQADCLRAALEAIEAEPAVLGAFLWKWFPEPHPVGRTFQLATPVMRRVVRDVWRPGRADNASTHPRQDQRRGAGVHHEVETRGGDVAQPVRSGPQAPPRQPPA